MKALTQVRVQAMAEEITELINSPLYALSGRRIQELQQSLAANFGLLHGWIPSSTPIGLRQLSEECRNRSLRHCIGDTYSRFADHGYGYRGVKGGTPTAVAAHLYDYLRSDKEALAEVAKQLSLTMSIVTDYPSWWFPGSTTLVLWTREGIHT